jgi:hypothetical protein
MGEAKRRRGEGGLRSIGWVGNTEFLGVARDATSPWSLPEVGAALIGCEIGTRGELTRELCREAADWTAKALDTQPGVMMVLTVGGFHDDPREVLDIPEARQAFAWFGERLRELDEAEGAPRLLSRLDSFSRAVMLEAMGLIKADITYTKPGAPALVAQHEADRARVKAADEAYRAAQAAGAAEKPRQ